MSRGWVENGGCRITVAPGHLAKEIMLKKSTRHIRLFLWLSFRCLVSLRQIPASRPSSNDQRACNKRCRHSSKFVRLDLANFFRGAKSLRLEANESLPKA